MTLPVDHFFQFINSHSIYAKMLRRAAFIQVISNHDFSEMNDGVDNRSGNVRHSSKRANRHKRKRDIFQNVPCLERLLCFQAIISITILEKLV